MGSFFFSEWWDYSWLFRSFLWKNNPIPQEWSPALVNTLNFESENQAKNISVVLSSWLDIQAEITTHKPKVLNAQCYSRCLPGFGHD